MYPNQGPPNPYGGYNPYPGSAPFGGGQQAFPGSAPFGGGNQPYGMPQQPFGAGFPQMPQPGMNQPGMPQPGMNQPGMPLPGMNQPGMPQPGFSSLGMPQAGMQQPGMQQPGMQQPGMQQPGMQQPGMQQGMPPQPFNYQSPPMNPGFPSGAGFPPQQQPPMGQPGFPPQHQPSFQPLPPTSQPAAYPSLPQGGFGVPDQTIHQHQYSQQNSSYGAPPLQQQYGASGQMPAQQPPSKPRGRPTVTPVPNFNASNDAAALRKAMKGFGTDNDALIETLCRRSNVQRMEIVRTYKTAYGKDLASDIKSETSGNFENLLIALLSPTSVLYARELYEAMCGEGTDEDVLIEVMCTMSNYEIREIGAYYQRMFGKSLEQELRNDTSGSFKRLMTSLSCGSRDESMVTDVNEARNDAQELKRAGVDKWGTDESAFNRVLCLRNYEQIKLIAQEYEKLSGNSLEKDIKREFSGDIEDGLLSILRVAHNRAEFFARRLHKSMAGIGTADKSLIRLVVTRSEIDMMDVKEEFQRYYGKSLKSFIKGDTSGHYKHALYALIGENRA